MDAMQGKQPTFREWLKRKLRDLYHAGGEAVPDLDKCPLKAPWPPGVQSRVIDHPLHGKLLQLRDNAPLPREWHERFYLDPFARFAGRYSVN